MTKNLQRITDEHISFQHAPLDSKGTTFTPTSPYWHHLSNYLNFHPKENKDYFKIRWINYYISLIKNRFNFNNKIHTEILTLARRVVKSENIHIRSNIAIALACSYIIIRKSNFKLSFIEFKGFYSVVGRINKQKVTKAI